MRDPLDILTEWVVWASLDNKKDFETILLKGHILIEITVDRVLSKSGIDEYKDYSFFRKVNLLRNLKEDNGKLKLIIPFLERLNSLRNKLAHESLFDINNGEFEGWCFDVYDSCKGTKFSKYTHRTKIIHSFSILSKNIIYLIYVEN